MCWCKDLFTLPNPESTLNSDSDWKPNDCIVLCCSAELFMLNGDKFSF